MKHLFFIQEKRDAGTDGDGKRFLVQIKRIGVSNIWFAPQRGRLKKTAPETQCGFVNWRSN
jgi:hypothetical protein